MIMLLEHTRETRELAGGTNSEDGDRRAVGDAGNVMVMPNH